MKTLAITTHRFEALAGAVVNKLQRLMDGGNRRAGKALHFLVGRIHLHLDFAKQHHEASRLITQAFLGRLGICL